MKFKCIYDEHVSCFCVLQCEDCGTVVLYYEDERWEENFKCPVCTDYQTGYEFWTKKDIEKDENKQKALEDWRWMAKQADEGDERIKNRGGLYDWQLMKKFKFAKTTKGYWEGEFHIDNITNKWKLKGLRLDLNYWKASENGMGFHWAKKRIIPLSWEAFRLTVRLRREHKKDTLMEQAGFKGICLDDWKHEDGRVLLRKHYMRMSVRDVLLWLD